MLRLLLTALVSLLVAAALAADKPAVDVSRLPPGSTVKVDFARDVQPILQQRCIECHGANKQKAGLRLDDGEHLLKGGDSGASVVPGKSADSRLIHLVGGLVADSRMPPKGAALSAGEVGKLRAWIDQGARWPKGTVLGTGPKHWSFEPVRRPQPPAVKNARWVRNDVDRFVLARLEAAGVAPSPEADRTTLIRRLSLDLTGLPPTPEEVDAFLDDKGDDAYAKVVDRLLASPHFGENWARHWLDLARYADSDGYEKDLLRPHAWRWREWVIDAINHDLPYNRFTIDQIAGDLMPGHTLEQRVATGFHRNTLVNHEGGIDVEEDRVKAVVDRVDTVAAVWLGLTAGCAECHSHKYDPITQREYYQLYAFFNNSDDRDVHAPLSADAETIAKRRSEFLAARKKYLEGAASKDFSAWTRKVADLPDVWALPDSYELPTFTATDGVNLYPQQDGSFLVTGAVVNPNTYMIMCNTKLKGITGIRVEALADDMLPNGGPGYDARGNFVLSEFRVEASPLADVTKLKAHAIERAVADYAAEGFEIDKALDGNARTGWSVDLPDLPMHGLDRCAVFIPKESIGEAGGTRLKISLLQVNNLRQSLGRFRVMLTTADQDKVLEQAVPQRIRALAAVAADKRTPEQQATLLRYYHATTKRDDEEFRTFTLALHEWLSALGETRAQILVERSVPRKTHVHVRGDFLRNGAEVQPGTPAILPPLAAGPDVARPLNRLDLANWLVRADNPLTARVEVNRVWCNLFGQGLVTSLADFGTQGDRPTHPELLDWLASEFVRLGWSRKALIKVMVTSATYRQSSKHRANLVARDPRNRLLARQDRFRLTAEQVRDQYLAVSSLLDVEVGGASLPATSRRRGLYVQYKRTTPEAMLATFDAPAASVTCPMRLRSNTPLQSLTLLNDSLFVNCARGLARRVMKEAKGTRDEQLRRLFRLCVARQPDDVELKALRTLFERAEKVCADDNDKATDVGGEDLPLEVIRSEAAALVIVARVVLNLDEAIMRE